MTDKQRKAIAKRLDRILDNIQAKKKRKKGKKIKKINAPAKVKDQADAPLIKQGI